ncbi:MAG: hypothetical protein HKN87_02575 [Saprospiraceae bacterium]|nr:hypothetical protein [Saprospiraceae bacterium]
MEALDYRHNGDQGIKDREAFKRTDSLRQHLVLDIIPHHLYVCPSHSEEFKCHLRSRNILRKDDHARKTYLAMKSRMAEEENQDCNRYVALNEILSKDWIYHLIDTRST